MSDTYTKLFRSITASTIVSEPLATRWLWVTLLSQADGEGCVWASVPGLARLANIDLPDCEVALACFLNPDPYSRTQENEGRRIEAIDGGWRLLNHAKYDALRSAAERAEYKREWDRKNRPSGHQRGKSKSDSPTQGPTASDSSPTKPDSPTASLTSHFSTEDQERSSKPTVSTDLLGKPEPTDLKTARAERLAQVTDEAIAAFNGSTLVKPNGGMLATVSAKVGRENRQRQVNRCLRTVRAICAEDYQATTIVPEFWPDYWANIARDDFMAGRQAGGRGHEHWLPDFEYLTREATMLKVYDRAASEEVA
jgi:hypothetical protein